MPCLHTPSQGKPCTPTSLVHPNPCPQRAGSWLAEPWPCLHGASGEMNCPVRAGMVALADKHAAFAQGQFVQLPCVDPVPVALADGPVAAVRLDYALQGRPDIARLAFGFAVQEQVKTRVRVSYFDNKTLAIKKMLHPASTNVTA